MSTRSYGSQSMVGALQRVLVRRPDASVGNADPVRWHYTTRVNLSEAQREHDAFVALLNETGCEVDYHDIPLPDHADAQFTHDPSLVCDQGAIILSMGKDLRRGEEAAQARMFEKLGVPVHFRLHGDARGEGGDMLWLDRRTLLVGLGFRTNMAAVDQKTLRSLQGFIDLSYRLGRLLAQWHSGGPSACAVPVEIPLSYIHWISSKDVCVSATSVISE